MPQTNPIGGVNQSVGVVPGLSQTNPIGGAGTGQNFGALPGDPGSPTYDPNAAAATAEQSGWDIGFRHNYAKHQHWRNHYPRRVHGLKRAANFSEPMLDLAAG